MHHIAFEIKGKRRVEYIAGDGELIIDAARQAGVMIDSPCNGNGTCGKCKVRILSGEVGGNSSERLEEEAVADGYVLACQCHALSDLVIEVPDLASSFQNKMQITDLSASENKNIRYVRKKLIQMGMTDDNRLCCEIITLPKPDLDDNVDDKTRLWRYFSQTLGFADIHMSLSVMRKLPDILRVEDFKVKVVYLNNGETAEILDVAVPFTDARQLYGIALDIGTTSVSACLVDMDSNEIVAKASMGNAQVKYGGDVINRIVYSLKPGGLEKLRAAVVDETINPLIEQIVLATGIRPTDIYTICAAGNTTMVQLLLGVNPDYLRQEPFIPGVCRVNELAAMDLGININAEGRIYLAPSVASYVGGDITTGVFAVPLWLQEDFTMLVDLGTNGEIVFGNQDFMMTCACSAGPAFEGGEISCGTRAVPGAIETVHIDDTSYKADFHTIGDEKTVAGICGSGIIDLICELKRVGLIDGKGRMPREFSTPRIAFDDYDIGRYLLLSKDLDGAARDIYLTEVDIDSFIKAKGAVFSAINTLLKTMDMPVEILSNIYVAGGIGTNLNIHNAIALGMLPDIEEEKYYFIGNSSIQGSYLALTLAEAKEKIESIADNMTYVELSAHPGYMDEFISACFIPHTDKTLFPSLNQGGMG
ncbi:corrinoid activation/regeneration protein AcsV [Eubacterium barkeri]|uniref:Uncharacterized 2Fe-2 and 4Fe-4S clusters-containing protein, contains DUF4445 domain n=1 Tax=Eubacterium barkeri TaxID=1528 RepID=A0A1H3EGL4_EUBBA|nr:corrinoid activation/regeneration protein AcsV [Eubacterium barkeri]SDX77882.1 Uncharacterized 2Fe-2 and 4Fe-4S clusters-containing protein, contains DUF4445 domain [Eubacterium barkeri]